jgi:hypothetical protein
MLCASNSTGMTANQPTLVTFLSGRKLVALDHGILSSLDWNENVYFPSHGNS